MREILFRGKRVDTREWIFGDLVHSIYHVNDVCIKTASGTTYDVIPETVGQYVGIFDNNGKHIFEGDIIRHYTCVAMGDTETFVVASVYWNDKFHAWARTVGNGETPSIGYIRLGSDCAYVVIGNIYDGNPVLLN